MKNPEIDLTPFKEIGEIGEIPSGTEVDPLMAGATLTVLFVSIVYLVWNDFPSRITKSDARRAWEGVKRHFFIPAIIGVVASVGIFSSLILGVGLGFFWSGAAVLWFLIGHNLRSEFGLPFGTQSWRIICWPYTLYSRVGWSHRTPINTLVLGVASLLCIQFYIAAPGVDTLSENTGSVHNLTKGVVLLFIFGQLFFGLSKAIVVRRGTTEVLEKLLKGILAYCFISVMIRVFAGVIDEFVASALEEPTEMLYLGIVVLCVTLFFKTLYSLRDRSGKRMGQAEMVQARTIRLTSPIENKLEDLRVSAIHEAGHALVAGAYEHEYVRANVFPHVLSSGTMGRVKWRRDVRLYSKEVLEAEMLMVLGGQAAERVIMGNMVIGSSKDVLGWQELAKTHFSNGYDHLYLEPRDRREVAYNAYAYGELRERHLGKLERFFNVNRDLLEELAKALEEEKELSHEKLKPFFTRMAGQEILTEDTREVEPWKFLEKPDGDQGT